MISIAGSIVLLILGCYVAYLAGISAMMVAFIIVVHWVRSVWPEYEQSVKKALRKEKK